MRPPDCSLWRRVPGDESGDSETEAAIEERRFTRNVQACFEEVVGKLGDRWTETPFIDFSPARAPQAGSKAGAKAAAAPRDSAASLGSPHFRLLHVDAPVLRDTFRSNGLHPTSDRDFSVQWSGPAVKDQVYQELGELQRVNHFPGSTELTRKNRMWANFAQMAEVFGEGDFDFVPRTYVLPDDLEAFMEAYEREDAVWIVKPSASSRGRGIFLLRDIKELPLEAQTVVCRYVDNPLLIQSLKFDLRVYVLVTGYDPLRAYVYREGLVRFASMPYSKEEEHLRDAYRHLTNYSINKMSSGFVENMVLSMDNVGHKWSFSALNKHLRCVDVDVDLMWVRIMDLIVKALLSVAPSIAARAGQTAAFRCNCFELYGFDVMVDEALKPWLLEVNLSPSMQAESPLDWQIKSSLLSDSFNLVGIAKADRRTIAASRPPRGPRASCSRFSSQPPGGRRGGASAGRRSLAAATAFGRERLGDTSDDGSPLCTGPAGGDPASLEDLGEEELKALARALQEGSRCGGNFIRLYPTPSTLDRYANILEQQSGGKGRVTSSQRLAALLRRGMPSPSPSASPRPSSAGSPSEEAEAPDVEPAGCVPMGVAPSLGLSAAVASSRRRRVLRPEPPPSPSAPRSGAVVSADREKVDPEGGAAAQGSVGPSKAWAAAKAFGVREGSRLLAMEYLLRLQQLCSGPPPPSVVATALASLRGRQVMSRLVLLRERLRSYAGVAAEPHRSVPDIDFESVLRSVGGACKACLLALATDAVGDAGESDDEQPGPPYASGRGGLADLLPRGLTGGANGRRAVACVSLLSVPDLERLIFARCHCEFRALLSSEGGAGGLATVAAGALAGPLRPRSGGAARRTRSALGRSAPAASPERRSSAPLGLLSELGALLARGDMLSSTLPARRPRSAAGAPFCRLAAPADTEVLAAVAAHGKRDTDLGGWQRALQAPGRPATGTAFSAAASEVDTIPALVSRTTGDTAQAGVGAMPAFGRAVGRAATIALGAAPAAACALGATAPATAHSMTHAAAALAPPKALEWRRPMVVGRCASSPALGGGGGGRPLGPLVSEALPLGQSPIAVGAGQGFSLCWGQDIEL